MAFFSYLDRNSVKYLYKCIIILSAFGCDYSYALSNNNICYLKGEIKGLGNGSLIFSYYLKGKYKVDTVYALNDRFEYRVIASDDSQVQLYVSGDRFTSFWCESGLIKVTGSIEAPYKLTITGTNENNILNSYKQAIEWKFDKLKEGKSEDAITALNEKQRKATLNFINKNLSSITAALLLYWQTMTYEEYIDTYSTMFKSFPRKIQNCYQGRLIAKRLELLANQPLSGKKAPNFTLPDTSGKPIVLDDFKGQYVLLDFWGHWCTPCLKAFPLLKQIKQLYADKVSIISIAAEHAGDKGIWKKTIRDNNLNWTHLSELKADKGNINLLYNITAYPTYLLLDRNGIILERANDLILIEKKLGSIK